MIPSAILLLSSLISSTFAFNYVVGVGKDEVTGQPGIGFTPSRTVTNRTGLPGQDTLVFSFLQGQHQVVQSSFNSPCTPLPGGFTTILQTVANGTLQGAGPIYSFPVQNGSEPLFFYDAAGTNCATGAVLCVNTNETTIENCTAFRAAAIAQGGNAYAAYTQTARSGFTLPTAAPSTSSTSSVTATGLITGSPSGTTAAAIPAFTRASAGTINHVSAVVGGLMAIAGIAMLL